MNTETNQSSIQQDSLIALAIEVWRARRLFERICSKLDMTEAKKYASQVTWFSKKSEEALEASGIKIVTLDGLPYDTGMAATAINADEFTDKDQLVVEQTVEPTIMGTTGILRMGTVLLRKI